MRRADRIRMTDDLAQKMGVERCLVRKTMDVLWSDVIGDADISDNHPRFYQHLGLLHVAWDLYPDLQSRMENLISTVEANCIERAAIRRMTDQLL